MKKNIKLSLAAAVLIPVFALADTTVPLIADAGDGVTLENIVGEVRVSNDTNDLNVTYEITADNAYMTEPENPTDNLNKWCITETHTDAEGSDPDDAIPTTNKGLAKIGLFEAKGEYECGSSVDPILLPIPTPNDGNVTIGAHAVVKQLRDLKPDYLSENSNNNIKLPQEVGFTHLGASSVTYMGIEIHSDDDLDGEYLHAWCIDPLNHIKAERYFPVTAVSSYDVGFEPGNMYYDYVTEELDGNAPHIKFPGNLPQINYVVNKFDDGDYDASPKTRCDVQQAMWMIANGTYAPPVECKGWDWEDLEGDVARADAIVADAEINGENYKPGCDDEMVVVLLGDPFGGSVVRNLQTTIVHIPVPCEETWGEETAWGGNYDAETGMTIDRFVPNNWSMHFEHTITQ